MGRDWYNRGGCKSGKKTKRGFVVEDRDGDEEDSSSATTSSSTTTGCITAVSQFFDLHHFHLRILPTHTNAAAHDRRRRHHQPPPSAADARTLPPRPPRHILKGLEAPRNSLEEDAFGTSCSNATSVIHQTMQKLDNLNIPMGRIQIKTSTRGEDTNTSTTQTPRESTSNTKKVLLMYSSADDNTTLCSPGPKTPNLVARLMGLDTAISPSPPPSHSSYQRLSYSCPRRRSCSDNITSGARSLPETPRVSSERRSDVDLHHRFSLQINKENNVLFEHENMSPRNYAKQILKQVKERVSRRIGMDITNTVNSGSNNKEEIRRDENLLGTGSRSKNRSQTANLNKDERKQQQQVSSKKINNISLPPIPSIFEEVSKLRAPKKKDQEEKGKPSSVNKKCKKFAGNSMMMKKEEPFIRASASRAVNSNSSDKKCKRTAPLSLSNNDLQSFLPPHVKRDPSPPLPATKLPLKQALSDDARCSKFTTTSQLSSGSSHSDQQKLVIQVIQKRHVDLENTLHGSSSELGLIHYLTALLRRIGISKDTGLVFLSRWLSASSHRHPFNPSIFHNLELAFSAPVTSQLSLRCNRRLTFDLAGEILGDLMNPYVKLRTCVWVKNSGYSKWHHHHLGDGGQLIDQMFAKIRNFPQANCQTLQDIDALVDRDLKDETSNVAQNLVVAFEEEGARAAIVSEIERDILDSLVRETTAFLVASGHVD